MGLCKTLDEFVAHAERLFLASPDKTRYSVSYRHSDAKLELRVTDSTEAFKFRTDQAADVKRMEKFSTTFLRMSTAKTPEEAVQHAVAVDK